MLSFLLAGSIALLSLGRASATVKYTGVNIAGFDFGAQTDGSCDLASIYGPVEQLRYGNNPDGCGQMVHFTNSHGFNMFRLPVAWQFLVNTCGGTLNTTNFAEYNLLVQGCLATGSYCIIDIHNFARWDGAIIGQGGPSNEEFASLWSQLATQYASKSKMVFGIMNEPHDIPDIDTWGQSVQAAVTAIRQAGATSQMILLPGTDYTSAETFVSSGSAAALASVTNLDGSTTNLIFDVHKYLDSDNSGTHSNCVTNNINDTFQPFATYLRSAGRQALLSETGGGSNDPTCLTNVCQELAYLEQNSDVYLGYLGWAAGSFSTSYILSLTPFGNATAGWTDQPLLTQCFATGGGPSYAAAPGASTSAVAQILTTLPSPSSSAVAVKPSTSKKSPEAISTSSSTGGLAIASEVPYAATYTLTSTTTPSSAAAATPSSTSSSTSISLSAEAYQPPTTFSTAIRVSTTSTSTAASSLVSAASVPSETNGAEDGGDDSCEL